MTSNVLVMRLKVRVMRDILWLEKSLKYGIERIS